MGLVRTDIPLPLTDPSLWWLARLHAMARGTFRTVHAGQVLVREGDRPSAFWAVQRGAIQLSCTGPSGWRATLAILGPGAVFGEDGLGPRGRPDTPAFPEARALIASSVCSFTYPALRAALAADPRLARWVAVAVGRRASMVQVALARTLTMRVGDRIVGVLRELAGRYGRAVPEGMMVDLQLTQDLLASMVGATRESVNRALSGIEDRGLVRRVGLRYVLPSRSSAPDGPS
jgi:CRP/FNR family cyclic AMP-dependent transcriptional regulator